MKRLFNVVHWIIMCTIYASIVVFALIWIVKLILSTLGLHPLFTWTDWLILIATVEMSLNAFFIVKKNVMNLFGFPFYNDEDPLP